MKTTVSKQILAFVILILFLPVFAYAEDVKIVEAEGKAMLGYDTTRAQAEAKALNNAIKNALLEAVGFEITSNDFDYQAEAYGSNINYSSGIVSRLVTLSSRGILVKKEIIKDECNSKDNQFYCFIKIKAYVKPLNLERKGNFKISTAQVQRVDKKPPARNIVFQDNDEIRVSARANKASYINIFSVSQDGMIIKLFPNDYFEGEVIPADKEFIFPDDAQRALGLKLRVKTPEKLSRTVESILIIATKEKVDFLSDKAIATPTITDLMQELSKLDPSLWAEDTVGYEVSK
ncbi:MAG: hypothetical protein IEMM0007_0798 [bacterium]|nr:MAG: hypothetical protein IEMM0007_0798 [bacterium]